jgi:hypothetical protein
VHGKYNVKSDIVIFLFCGSIAGTVPYSSSLLVFNRLLSLSILSHFESCMLFRFDFLPSVLTFYYVAIQRRYV